MADDLADLLASMAGDQGSVEIPCVQFLTGEVTDGSVYPPLIQVGASTAGVPCPVVGGYFPAAGDFVVVLAAGASRVCLGRIQTAGGVRLQRASNQSATGAGSTTISWDTEISDQGGWWSSGTDITVPTGAGGVYTVTAQVDGAGNWTSASALNIFVAGIQWRFATAGSSSVIGGGITAFIAAGQVITATVFNAGTTQNFTGRITVFPAA